jgi:hypothetical protein
LLAGLEEPAESGSGELSFPRGTMASGFFRGGELRSRLIYLVTTWAAEDNTLEE